jgi:hypothetical protein
MAACSSIRQPKYCVRSFATNSRQPRCSQGPGMAGCWMRKKEAAGKNRRRVLRSLCQIKTRDWANIEPPAKSIIASNFVFIKSPFFRPSISARQWPKVKSNGMRKILGFAVLFWRCLVHQAGVLRPLRDCGMLMLPALIGLASCSPHAGYHHVTPDAAILVVSRHPHLRAALHHPADGPRFAPRGRSRVPKDQS